MNILLFPAILGFIFALFFIIVFKKLKLTNINTSDKITPYAGGTILLFTIVSSLMLNYFLGIISFFKFLFFFLSLFCIYFMGFINDLYEKINYKNLSTGKLNSKYIGYIAVLFNLVANASVSIYIFCIFNENYWFLKGMITLLFIYLYNFIGINPGRSLKLYYFIFLMLNLSDLKWTKELYIASILSASSYYFFDAMSLSILGCSGLNILGLTTGLVFSEALGGNINLLILSVSILAVICAAINKKIFPGFPKFKVFLEYIDNLLVVSEKEISTNEVLTCEKYSHTLESDSLINTK